MVIGSFTSWKTLSSFIEATIMGHTPFSAQPPEISPKIVSVCFYIYILFIHFLPCNIARPFYSISAPSRNLTQV